MSTKAILDKTTNKCKGETADGRTSWTEGRWLLFKVNCVAAGCPAGYGFVDFDSPSSAQKAVTALKAGGVQAQMAKVRTPQMRHLCLVDLRLKFRLILAFGVCVDGSVSSR